jgi:hypothetical protein
MGEQMCSSRNLEARHVQIDSMPNDLPIGAQKNVNANRICSSTSIISNIIWLASMSSARASVSGSRSIIMTWPRGRSC